MSEGVTIPIQKKNKVWFTESRGQKRVVFTRKKRSGRPVRGTCGSGSTGSASAEVPRRQWVRRTSIPAVETSPENLLLNVESVCSQVVPGSHSSCK